MEEFEFDRAVGIEMHSFLLDVMVHKRIQLAIESDAAQVEE